MPLPKFLWCSNCRNRHKLDNQPKASRNQPLECRIFNLPPTADLFSSCRLSRILNKQKVPQLHNLTFWVLSSHFQCVKLKEMSLSLSHTLIRLTSIKFCKGNFCVKSIYRLANSTGSEPFFIIILFQMFYQTNFSVVWEYFTQQTNKPTYKNLVSVGFT